MEKVLEQYFVQNNELVLTNIGTLHLSKKPAAWIGDTLHAPELTISFSTNNKKPSNNFYTYLAEALSISNEQANIQFEQFLENSFDAHNNTLSIGNLGSIEKIGDEYTWNNKFISNHYFKDITISPITTSEEMVEKKSLQWPWIALILSIIAIAAIVFKSF
ncbi:MAG: hypothetical protein RL262_787 [Bacteroidota bacterium]|jgi:hypothetical protein